MLCVRRDEWHAPLLLDLRRGGSTPLVIPRCPSILLLPVLIRHPSSTIAQYFRLILWPIVCFDFLSNVHVSFTTGKVRTLAMGAGLVGWQSRLRVRTSRPSLSRSTSARSLAARSSRSLWRCSLSLPT